MYDRAAMRRSRWRYLAPIALAAAITGTYLVVHNGLTHKSSTTPAHVSVVKHGDTLSSISQKTGVSIETLQSLNHSLIDPNSLHIAQRLRLRR
jgi:LysM repeat protein